MNRRPLRPEAKLQHGLLPPMSSVPTRANSLALVANRRNGPRWVIALALGLRQGEALGLKWEHVDLTAGLLRIRRNRLRPKYKHGCGGTCGRKAGYCPDREQVRADAGRLNHVLAVAWLACPNRSSCC